MKLKDVKKKELIVLVQKIYKNYEKQIMENVKLEEVNQKLTERNRALSVLNNTLAGDVFSHADETEELTDEIEKLKDEKEYLINLDKVKQGQIDGHIDEIQKLQNMSIWQFFKWRASND